MFRFFVNQKQGDFFVLSATTVKHLKVVRLENKQFICVYESKFFKCSFVAPNLAKIESEILQNHEFEQPVILGMALIKPKNFELVIQKATELGVTKIIPFISQHCESKINNIESKIKRWEEIALHAAQQSFRNIIPTIEKPINLKDLLNEYQHIEHKFIAHEKVDKENFNALFLTNTIFLVGPEGGFSDSEIDLAKISGFKPIRLTKTILRAETAAIFLLSRIKL